MVLRCSQRGLLLAVCCTSLLAGSFGEAVLSPVPVGKRFLSRQGSPVAGKRATLLTKGPGFFRGEGLRSGVETEALGEMGDTGAKADSTLASSPFADSMAYRFPMLDNMEPTAPMDRMHAALGSDPIPGEGNALYVPPYLNPDAFPTFHGAGCNCTLPTKEKKEIQCECGKEDENTHYTWLKDTPVLGTKNYTLTPADITYPAGNYWGPKLKNGLIAPADVLPIDRYPNQALADHVWPLPASAREDRMPVRYSRYMDQVQDRSKECDTVSKKCTVPCKPGDDAVAIIGNTIVKVKIVKTFVGNALQVKFVPHMAEGATETADCPLQAACSVHRFCKGDKPQCIHQKDTESYNWAGLMHRKHACPPGSKVCKEVTQVITATMVKKGDKACRAAVF